MHELGRWLMHVLGLDNASGGYYLAWSGWVGDVVIIGALLAWWRKHNCQRRWCPFWAHHPVGDSSITVCRWHHPRLPNKALTAEQIDAIPQRSQPRS